jgi:hypothetical protein
MWISLVRLAGMAVAGRLQRLQCSAGPRGPQPGAPDAEEPDWETSLSFKSPSLQLLDFFGFDEPRDIHTLNWRATHP